VYKACIFDLDGTLSDTLNSIAYFANNALEKFGLAPIPTERYKILVGDGAKNLVRRMMEENNCNNEALFEKLFEYYNSTYNNDFLYLTKVYDGIYELLELLKSEGIKIAVLSNKPHETTTRVVGALFCEDYFDACYGGRDGIPLKPDPYALCEILKELGVAARQCLYIGDTKVDMQTGKNANITTVGVLWGFRGEDELRENGADIIVKKPIEIYEYIKKRP
jgi:phosphoglycolate phosphatase